ncbi:MAG: SIS domain-containing protein [Candidatus Hodarchaeota archaeon]
MFYTKVPINIEGIEKSFTVFNFTWKYLFEQVRENLTFVFNNQREQLLTYLNFLIGECCEKQANNDSKIVFAAAGRSLFMGAKPLAHRLAQLDYNVEYPYPEINITGPPSAKISEGDTIIAISTSGRTASVVQKVEFGRTASCDIIIESARPESKISEGPYTVFLHVPDKLNEEKLKGSNADLIFSPLGTNSEFTHAIFSELLGRGLYEMKKNNKDADEALKIMEKSMEQMITTGESDLKKCVLDCVDDIKEFIANMILKFYSNHTIHLFGRGKIFDMQIAPFEMRLRQMPHGFITSIIDYATMNRPVRAGQLVILSSGSGALSMTAQKVKKLGAMIIGLTSQKQSPFYDLLDIKIHLGGRKSMKKYDWELRQWKGGTSEWAPEGSQFEINGCVFFEAIFAAICDYAGVTEKDLAYGHVNL